MKKIILFSSFLFAIVFCNAQKTIRLKAFKHVRTNVAEPSDIGYTSDFSHFYIVSDQGYLYETDTAGKILKTATVTGIDFEALFIKDNFIYVADERSRVVHVYTLDSLKHVKEFSVPYSGGANDCYEGIAYNEKKKCFILLIEKNPSYLFELDDNFVKTKEIPLNIATDISSACYHKGFLYLLSDIDGLVLKLDPSDYSVLQKWSIPVTNPEGITFDKAGNLVIVSDKDQTIYKFPFNDSEK